MKRCTVWPHFSKMCNYVEGGQVTKLMLRWSYVTCVFNKVLFMFCINRPLLSPEVVFSGGNYSKRIDLVRCLLLPNLSPACKNYSAPRAKMTAFGGMVQFTRLRAPSVQFGDNRPLHQ